ncbi:MAG: alpha/beta hydrolase [Anaerolineales bacterium]|nr:MAG: alpha/beta hydrolase [Anaerolineales bacterium]
MYNALIDAPKKMDRMVYTETQDPQVARYPNMKSTPSRMPPFEHLYAAVDADLRQSLSAFRRRFKPKRSLHEGIPWDYVALGEGGSTALFLPGAAGSYDIWWQQLTGLADDLRLISISYPPIDTLEGLSAGLNQLLQNEGVERFHVIGSSMGGYLAQYLASTQPDSLLSAVCANTFVPTQPVLRILPTLQIFIRLLPLPVLMTAFRWIVQHRLVPAGGDHPLLHAYLMETSFSGLTKDDLLARSTCTMQSFTPCRVEDQSFPMLIIESANDPLIQPHIRQALLQMYPLAQRHTFRQAGHFPYLSRADSFTATLRSFLLDT